MANFAKDTPLYRKPDPLKKDWNYVGDGKFHDIAIKRPEMHSRRWTIDTNVSSGKSFDKFQQGLGNK